MNEQELLNILLEIPSESRSIEFKRLGESRNKVIDKVLQSIVAMANTEGGSIILGIDDPQKTLLEGIERVFGIEENLELYDELGQCIKKITAPMSTLWPPLVVGVPNSNLRVAVISVPKVGDGFRSYENHVFVRQELSNKILTPQEIIQLSYAKGFNRADTELVEIDLSLLQTDLYQAWKRQRNIQENAIEKVLESTGLARKDGSTGILLPTRAAVLLFADFPTDILDTKCAVRVFQFIGKKEEIVGDTLNLIGKPKNFIGPIAKQIKDVHEYVLGILQSGIRVPSGFTTTYKIPERAIKEAITNAVIHRDYFTKRDIEIKIFENRVTIESPGLLPFNITPNNIGHERANGYRNDLLVKHLRDFPDPPNLDQNEGVKAMRKVMDDASLYPPIFISYPSIDDGLKVILFNEEAPTEWDKVSQYLSENKYINNSKARELLNTDNTVKVSKLLNRWVKQELLTKIMPRTGSKRNVKYRLRNSDDQNLFTLHKSK